VGRCGLTSAYQVCSAFQAPTAPWPSPTQNINLAFGYAPNLWAELSGTGSPSRFRFNDYAAATYKALGIRRWPRG
jgi:hypothetical protein